MSQVHISRYSMHPFIDRVWRSENVKDGTYLATPDGSWDIIVHIQPGRPRAVMLAGQFSESMNVPYVAGTSSVVVSFAAGAYLPSYPGKEMRNLAEMLPCPDENHFVLAGETFAIPSYENAEHLAEEMIRKGILAMDNVVAAILNGDEKALSDRSKQRHFLEVTGLTQKSLVQIRRAQEAVRQLQAGSRAVDVAMDNGYSDQAHLSKSLTKIMHRTPKNVGEIHKL